MYSSTDNVIQAVEKELNGSGNSIGYRAMHQRLITDYGLVIRKDAIREVLKVLDPDRVQARLRQDIDYKGENIEEKDLIVRGILTSMTN